MEYLPVIPRLATRTIPEECSRESTTGQTPPDDIEGKLEYEVEHIVRSEVRTSGRGTRRTNRIFYLVKWLGYPEDENSWEPAEMMEGSQEIVAEFHRENPEMPRA